MKLFVVMFVLLKLVSAQSIAEVDSVRAEAFLAQAKDGISSKLGLVRDSFESGLQDSANYFIQNGFSSFASGYTEVLDLLKLMATDTSISGQIDAAFELFKATIISLCQQATVAIQEFSCQARLTKSLTAFETKVQRHATSTTQTLTKKFEAEVKSLRNTLDKSFASIQKHIKACNSKRGAAALTCKTSVIRNEGPKVTAYLASIAQMIPDMMVNYFTTLTQSLNAIAQTLPTGLNNILSAPCK